MKKVTEQNIENFKQLKESGKTLKEISEITNFNPNTISKYLQNKPKNNIKGNEDLIVQLYNEGKSQKEIAELLGTYNTSVRRVLLRKGIELRGSSEALRLCKENPFKDGDEYSEYFLGLLLTDGCLTKTKTVNRNYNLVLSLSEIDSYMVYQYRDWLSPKSKVSKVYQKINGSYMYAVSVANPDVEQWLRTRGEFTDKSHKCQIYTPITWHILRGIFDGDGGFHINGKHLDFFICSASKTFIDQINQFLEQEGFEPHIRISKRTDSDFFYVEIYKIQDVIRLGKLMYNNASIYLQRKYDKWFSFYESKK